MRLVRRWLIGLVLALTFVPAASAGLPNPCTLLTNAQVAKAFGSQIANRTSGGNGGLGRSCSWTGVPLGPATSAHGQLMVQVAPMAEAQFMREAKRAKGGLAVRGVGELAYSVMNGGFIFVWQRGIELTMFASYVSSQTTKSLATAAVTRL
jgi:hypothetical protein